MATYSFLDVSAAITGPGGAFSIGSGAGISEEGLTVEMVEDKDSMMIGADGTPMHSLHAGQGGTVTVRLLKTSPTNGLLAVMYDLQTSSSALHGNNTIVISNTARGDIITCFFAAFRKFPNNPYAKEGGIIEWPFNCGKIFQVLGVGTPTLNP